jgi:chemotaxis protein CheX
MDAKLINPFIASIKNVMPQMGFANVEKGKLSVKKSEVVSPGVLIIVGIVGDVKGNAVYGMDVDSAKKIASTMMMGMQIDELDEMAQSALSELANMLTANAATEFANMGVAINISTPTVMYGNNFTAKMSSPAVLCIEILIDGIPLEINIAFENC